MPRNGSGTMVLTYNWENDAANSINISSVRMDGQETDIAAEITNSVPRDGQAAPTANLPMGNFKLTGLGSGSAATDSVTLGQVQAEAYQWLGSSSGTNTITATATPGITAYAAGQVFRFIAGGTNTGAATLNINALGAKTIRRNDSVTALAAGDITSGSTYEVLYNGTIFILKGGSQIPTALSVASVTTTGDATIGGNETVAGTLGVTGNTTLTTASTSGLATLNSASVTTTLSVGGTSTLHAINSSGAVSLTAAGTALAVTNNATVGGTLNVTGTTTLGTTNTGALTCGTISGALVSGGMLATQAIMETDTDDTRISTVAKLRFSPHAVQSWAHVGSGGTIVKSFGVTSASKTATGTYNVTLDPNFAAIVNSKIPTATISSAGSPGFISARDISSGTSLIEVKTYDTSGVAADREFHLTVVSSP